MLKMKLLVLIIEIGKLAKAMALAATLIWNKKAKRTVNLFCVVSIMLLWTQYS